jgi:hypothetical protein
MPPKAVRERKEALMATAMAKANAVEGKARMAEGVFNFLLV